VLSENNSFRPVTVGNSKSCLMVLVWIDITLPPFQDDFLLAEQEAQSFGFMIGSAVNLIILYILYISPKSHDVS
jgi:hypothetical protein